MKVGEYEIDIRTPVFADTEKAEQIKRQLSNYRHGFDDFDTRLFDEFIRKHGYMIHRVPRSLIYEMFGAEKRPVAGRFDGSRDLYIATELNDLEARTAAYHEIGHGYEKSEEEAQTAGMQTAASLRDFKAFNEMGIQQERLERAGVN
jgi:hypothetical protein